MKTSKFGSSTIIGILSQGQSGTPAPRSELRRTVNARVDAEGFVVVPEEGV